MSQQIITVSGYTDCACRTCFDASISNDVTEPELCLLCKEAGCDATGHDECERPATVWT